MPGRVVTDLLPPMADRQELGVELGLRLGDSSDYFIVTINHDSRPGGLLWDERVRRVLQYVWSVLAKWGDVAGPMPEIVRGHPLDML